MLVLLFLKISDMHCDFSIAGMTKEISDLHCGFQHSRNEDSFSDLEKSLDRSSYDSFREKHNYC